MSVPMQEPTIHSDIRFEWISESWKLFKCQARVWVLGALISFAVIFFVLGIVVVAFGVRKVMSGAFIPPSDGNPIDDFLSENFNPFLLTVKVINWTVPTYFLTGGVTMANAQLRGQPISVGMIFCDYRKFLRMLAYSTVTYVITLIGSIFFLVPGIILTGMLVPGYALVADGMSPAAACKASLKATKYHKFRMLLFTLLLGAILAGGCIPAGLGCLVTTPMLCLISALMYRDMIGMPTAIRPDDISPYTPQQPGMWPPPPDLGAEPNDASN